MGPLTTEQIIYQSPDVKFEDYFLHTKPGLFMEFGVASGRSIKMIASNTPNVVYGFDSFQGLPENWDDKEVKGSFKCDPPKSLPDNVKLIIGMFQDTLPPFLEEHKDEPIAFVHIDCDLYSSTKFILDCLKDRLEGTVLVFDEIVGVDKYLGHEYRAFNEFIEKTGYKWECLGRWDRLPRAGFRFYR